jgi:predicted nucleic acid-binding Zn finger protein
LTLDGPEEQLLKEVVDALLKQEPGDGAQEGCAGGGAQEGSAGGGAQEGSAVGGMATHQGGGTLCEARSITMSDVCMLALHSIFQQNLVPALELVERGGVTKYSCRVGGGGVTRELYRVQGSSGNQYLCFTSSSYCSCPSYAYHVLVRRDALLCKHQLAVRLATAMGRCDQVQVSGEEWADLAGME